MKSNHYINFIKLTVFFIASSSTGSTGELISQKKQISTYLQNLHHSGKFNGTVLVIKNGKPIHQKHTGYTDGSRTTEIDESSMFSIGSISKEFNSVGIMVLVEKGRLKLTDQLSQFKLNLPDWASDIQVKHLLNYTSGLPKVDFQAVKNADSDLEQLRSLKSLEFTPGTDYLYSNFNVLLQIRIIEQLSGLTYSDFLEENFFEPLSMKQAMLSPHSSRTSPMKAFNSEFENDFSYTDNFPLKIMVSLTACDLSKWLLALHNEEIINSASIKKLFNSHTSQTESSLGQSSYVDSKLIRHSHHGTDFNWESYLEYNLEEKTLVIVMTNQKQSNVQEIVMNITGILKS